MATPTIDVLIGEVEHLVMHDHSVSDLGAILDPRYLKLDQTTPQTTVGTFTFPIVHTQTINGGTTANADITIQGTTSSTRATSYVNLQPNGGYVGIGTDAPASPFNLVFSNNTVFLTVAPGAAQFAVDNIDPTDGNCAALTFRGRDNLNGPRSAAQVAGIIKNRTDTGLDGELVFITNNAGAFSQKMKISKEGYVGIANTAPAYLLDVVAADGTDSIRAALGVGSLAGLTLSSNSMTLTRLNTSQVGLTIKTKPASGAFGTTGGYIAFNPNDTEAMRIIKNGNVGIGVTAPQALLDVAGSVIFNDGGVGTYDVRMESDTEANMLFLDANGDTDGALYFGGTTNGVKVNKGGHTTLLGTATVFDDLNFDPSSSGGPTVTLPDYVVINDVVHREFTSANNQLCGDGEELPHSYKLSSTIYPHIHIFLKGGESAGTTGVTFTFYWELRQTTGTTSGSVTLAATTAQLGTTAGANKLDIFDSTGFAGSAELGGQLTVKIARTAGDAGDVVVTTYGVHYEIDSIGSNTATSKT